MNISDEQLAKLPLYAQKELTSLQRHVDRLKQELIFQQGSSPTRVTWGMSQLVEGTAGGFLREDEHVTLRLTPRNKIRIQFNIKEKGIDIFGDHSLLIRACASNHIFVKEDDE